MREERGEKALQKRLSHFVFPLPFPLSSLLLPWSLYSRRPYAKIIHFPFDAGAETHYNTG